MADPSSHTHVEAKSVSAEYGSLVPRLRFESELWFDTSNYEVRSIAAQGEVIFDGGTTSYDLPTIQTEKPIPRGTNRTTFRADCDLSRQALEQIEEIREGDELTFEVEYTLDILSTSGNESTDRVKKSVEFNPALSEWQDILETMEYHDARFVKVPLDAGAKTNDVLENAQATVERAQRRHDEGDYKDSVALCRDAIESLQHVDESVLSAAVDEQKLERIQTQLETFEKRFLGLFSHAQDRTGIEPALRRDSDFALTQTKSFIRYYATALSEQGDE